MPDTVRRGYAPEDEKEFNKDNVMLLRQVQIDISYLINRGYDLERTVTFTCNRFSLSARQRMVLIRSTAAQKDIETRKAKEITGGLSGETLYFDGFNLIISLETALSGTTLLLCMDGAVRDLAGLHGTYRLIDKTDAAIELINGQLVKLGVAKAVYYLDSPVSNSGRLKQRILELSAGCRFETEVNLIPNADQALSEREFVATSDAIILNNCKSWVNLSRRIICEAFPGYPFVNLS